jgi:hypothetical protein
MKAQLCQFKRYTQYEGPGIVVGNWESGIAFVNAFSGAPQKIVDAQGNIVPAKEIWQSNVLCTPTCFIDDGK